MLETADVISAVLGEARSALVTNLNDQYERGAAICESPIERLFLATLLHPKWEWEYDTTLSFLYPRSGLVANAKPPPMPGFWVWQQIAIEQYRVDFIIASTLHFEGRSILVELDGHDFHERTREQAAKDKARDRHLTSLGYWIMRFTGSEIYRDPFSAVGEILMALTKD